MSFFSPYDGPALVERAAFNPKDEYLVKRAIDYLASINLSEYPNLHILLNSSYVAPEETLRSLFKKSTISSESDVLRNRIISHNYSDAIAMLEKDRNFGYLPKLQAMIQVLILSQNWKPIDDIEHRTSSYAKAKSGGLERSDRSSLTNIRLLLSVANYSQGNYLECLRLFLQALEEDPSVVGFFGGQSQYLICTHEELIAMISISAVVSIPLDNYEEFMNLEELEPFLRIAQPLSKWLSQLIKTSYRDFLQEWNQWNTEYSQNMFVAKSWRDAQKTMRDKIYFFYLRVSANVEISYLSKTLRIEQDVVFEEIHKLIRELKLNFEFDGLIVNYRSRYDNSELAEDLLKSNQLLCEKFDIIKEHNDSLRCQVQRSIIANSMQQIADMNDSSPDEENG
ncbi:LADA_0F10638g1_1 [Lachancea dasiensis]|uniref:LADA_0F10638g1_1 n=1 Tax=Lachancea dasiensis TaxID=1072105 RepID=A0A1G4JLZ6_9SACH|nr:LADA_0F10638g1_1 [Lachancea dasiensis]